ncbi:MAG: hypothetical protein N3B11_02115 [Coriobacteriia bacterium]|nr:hypothetical protein [Coriobacteriia bacterium]
MDQPGTDRGPWSLTLALAHSIAWGFGVGVGVLAGALLTSVGAQGAPGAAASSWQEVAAVPLAAGATVAALRFAGSLAVAAVRGAQRRRSGFS